MEIQPTVKFNVLREQARSRIIQILDQVPGRKKILLDQNLVGPLSLIIQRSALSDHGAQSVATIQPFELQQVNSDIIYIVRPTIQMMQIISDQVQDYKRNQKQSNHRLYLFLCPRQTTLCEKILISRGVFGQFQTIEPLMLYLMPLQIDLLSMQMDSAFRDLVLQRDYTMYHYIARALQQIQHHFGPIPVKQAKGVASSHILNILQQLQYEDNDYITQHPISEISEVVLMDRQIDMVTPFCTPLTYEALIDEIFGISNNVVKVNPRVLEKQDVDKPVSISLTNLDTVFQQIRDLNFCVLKPLLTNKLKYIEQTYKEAHQQGSIDALKSYFSRFKQAHKQAGSVQNHLNLAIHITNQTIKNPFFNQNLECEHSIIMSEPQANILEHIQRQIGMGEDIWDVLRLLCLISVTQNGLRPKLYDFFRKELIQTYGFQHILTLANLQKAGLFKKQQGRNIWANLVKSFSLIKEDVNQKEPDDVAYAYAGYAPISLRLIERLYQTG